MAERLPLPPPPPTEPPFAYVVEYRALDQCFVPSCTIKNRDVFGLASEMQTDGDPGSYLQFGKHGGEFWEMFFHRGRVIPVGKSFSFELPESASTSELDMYLSAEEERQDFRASVVFEELMPSAPPRLLHQDDLAGHTDFVPRPRTAADYGHEKKAFSHARLPIPSRDHRVIRVTIKNTGASGLGLGSPLVMKRVEGRGARQALWVIYDAMPWPLWDAMLRGPIGDAKADWLPDYVAKNGMYFPNGLTPGLFTSGYSRRMLRGDGYYNDNGEPNIKRGFVDPLPENTHDVISEIAQQGVMTFAIVCNFSVLPNYTYLGWDGGYDTEQAEHPQATATVYKDWVKDHPNDDAFVAWWIASTHYPWPDTRPVKAPVPVPVGLPRWDLNPQILPQTWANAIVGTELLKEMLDTARAAGPNTSRMMYMSSDHGRGFTMRHEHRAFRSPITGTWPGNLSHGVGADSEEMRTPFAIIYEGLEIKPNPEPRVFNEDTSLVTALRAVENFFQVKLDLPDTSTFDSPAFTSQASYESRWDDGVIAACGMAQTYRFVRGKWAYAEYTPRLELFPIWEKPGAIQLMLAGTPYRSGRFYAEELYDSTRDPYNYTNVAGQNVDTTLDMRRRAADWFATYYDDASHGRYRYTLTFPTKVTLTITAPRAFDAWADGTKQVMRSPRSVEVTGTRIEIQEKDETVGVIEVRGDFASKPIFLRCAENGLPVDVTSTERPRLNLALGRTNCPVPRNDHVNAMDGSVMFSFEKAHAAAGAEPTAARGPGGMINEQELMTGMKKWGYVRDAEKKP